MTPRPSRRGGCRSVDRRTRARRRRLGALAAPARTILRSSTPAVAEDSPPMPFRSALPSSPVRYCRTVAQVGEVEQRQAVLVGVVEDQGERRRLGLVGAEHLGQELRAERPTRWPARARPGRRRRARGRSTGTAVGVHSMPSSAARPVDPVVRLRRAAAGRERSPFMSAANTGTPDGRQLLGHELQGDLVLPVPVAPAMRPWRLHMARGICTTASGWVVPSSTPRPESDHRPLGGVAAA